METASPTREGGVKAIKRTVCALGEQKHLPLPYNGTIASGAWGSDGRRPDRTECSPPLLPPFHRNWAGPLPVRRKVSAASAGAETLAQGLPSAEAQALRR